MVKSAEVVPATAEHFVRLKGAAPPRTVRAYTAVRGDAVLGIGGVYRAGVTTVLFSELTDDIRSDKRSLIRLIRAVKPMLKPGIVAHADPAIRGSEVLLEHLGFEKLEGEIWVR